MASSTRTSWLAVMAATLAGFGLLFAPRAPTDRIETLVNDAALPGLHLLKRAQSWATSLPQLLELEIALDPAFADTGGAASAEVLHSTIETLQSELRRLQSQHAQLLDELERTRAKSGSPFVAESGVPLFVPELLNANIVAADDVSLAIQRASAQRVVDVGHMDGVVPADFVVSPERQATQPRLLIDQGGSVGLHADQPVFAGRCVIGKVHQVGRWTSSVLPVADAEFRGRAQLMRRTAQGPIIGPEGIIAGDGQADCRLNFIAATEPVAVGDEVCTPLTGTPLPVPMYYGRVVAAQLPPGAPFWEITVKPAETIADARQVQVLRAVLNPSRMASPAVSEALP